MNDCDLIVIGGGAAGFFGAINAAMSRPGLRVCLIERTQQVLSKVRISGGGRCNVTHECFDIQSLIKNYPRGSKELLGPFSRFQPLDVIEWFKKKGVELKAEEDGRMFPISDSSETIIQCFMELLKKYNIELKRGIAITSIEKSDEGFSIQTPEGVLKTRFLLLATGSSPKGYELAKSFGHSIVPPVPSLFTFNVPKSPLLDLAGIVVDPSEVQLKQLNLKQTGPLLMTHWGFSGPAVLKLSAWGARVLHEVNYETELVINWIPLWSKEKLAAYFAEAKLREAAKKVSLEAFGLAKNLARRFLDLSGVPPELRFAALSKKQVEAIMQTLQFFTLSISGKTTYKQEFVTCGGIQLSEVNFKTMESKFCPGLFFAGEILNIDGVTGGFNFQSAWTTSWIAGNQVASNS